MYTYLNTYTYYAYKNIYIYIIYIYIPGSARHAPGRKFRKKGKTTIGKIDYMIFFEMQKQPSVEVVRCTNE